MQMWYKPNCPAGITTVTATLAGGSFSTLICHEVSGASATPFTSGEVATQNQGGPSVNPQIGPKTNATAISIFFASLTSGDQASDPAQMNINGTGTVGTWNLKSSTNSQEQDFNNFSVLSVPNIILAASTATTHGWTLATSVNWAGIIAAFHV